MSERDPQREDWRLPENAEVQLDYFEDVDDPSDV